MCGHASVGQREWLWLPPLNPPLKVGLQILYCTTLQLQSSAHPPLPGPTRCRYWVFCFSLSLSEYFESVAPKSKTRAKKLLPSLSLSLHCGAESHQSAKRSRDLEHSHVSESHSGGVGLAISTRLMELGGSSTHAKPDQAQEQARSFLAFDLNEIPSSSSAESHASLPADALSIVQAFHARPPPPPFGLPAGIPGGDDASACAACGLPEAREHVVVCDGCERGFHVGCTGMQGIHAVILDEWICGKCVGDGVRSNRWPLGFKSRVSGQKRGRVQLLDINASPPSDSECEESEGFPCSRKHASGDSSFGCNWFGDQSTCLNSFSLVSGFGFQKALKLSFEDILRHAYSVGRTFEEALKEFISERHGVLEEGWCVEFKTSIGSDEGHAVYRAPDGKIFNSIPEVACHLGLMSDERLPLAKRRKSATFSMLDGVNDSRETSIGLHEDFSSGFHTTGCSSKFEDNIEVMGTSSEESGGPGPQQFNDGLPVQYEDFFVLCLGEVDMRSAYHNVNQIWPVGYRSCWHDKITGSLFVCEVADGGDSGPIFRVRRCPCSTFPIPSGSTVLFESNLGQSVHENKEQDYMTCAGMDYEEYCNVQMLLSNASPPMEDDILSCLGSSSEKSFSVHASNCSQLEAGLIWEEFGNILPDISVTGSEIAEFSVEGSTSSSAWSMVSKKFIDACRHAYMKGGTLNLLCDHVENGKTSIIFDHNSEKDRCTSLARFVGSSRSIKIPSGSHGGLGLEAVFEELLKWLDQDRFGLDVDFVQEIIEQLPGIDACQQYVRLKERSYYSSSITVANGFITRKTQDVVGEKDKKVLDDLSGGCRREGMVEDCMMASPSRPPGKPIFSKLPPEIVGDVIQVWEFLWRFSEILGLEGPLSPEELEEELVSPWFDGPNWIQKFGANSQETHRITSPTTDGSSPHVFSSNIESGLAVTKDSQPAFIEIQTEVMKEMTDVRRESFVYSRCTGMSLIKAHCSMLEVLIGQLQSNVAAVMGPNFDAGESRPKRGRKKDMDWLAATRTTKLNLLPINELTWPELARRYILAFLSMDGNVGLPSGKIFRCLQGDGGMLCGSLTGVAGMEADALLLAQSMKKIFGGLSRENDMLSMDDVGSDETSPCNNISMGDCNIPEWALLLEPVRKLPTNVGTRIRKCVYNALEKDPPNWAKKILEHSISKEVYKGNASGPTKKAVLSVLADVHSQGMQQRPQRERKEKNLISVSEMIMKQCRNVLRVSAASDDAKGFCKSLGRKLIGCSHNDDEGILGSPAMVSRPLDFRTIDLRLVAGVYGGSHEAFLEDVQELWNHMRIAYSDRDDLVQLVEKLSSDFETLYEMEVVKLYQKFLGYAKLGCLTAESKKEIDDFLLSSSELPKAPWEEGICKICGIDKDDNSVLLCDTCDAEYHTYCLNPPLRRIPQGNWYCPSCIAKKHDVQDASDCMSVICHKQRRCHAEHTLFYMESLTHLSTLLERKENWEFGLNERIFLLKFLSDELLNSAVIRQHLEHSVELSADLQQRLHNVSSKLRSLKYKEGILAANVAQIDKYPSFSTFEGKSAGNSLTTEPLDHEDRCKDVQIVVEGNQLSNFSSHTVNLEKDKSLSQNELSPSNILQQKIKNLSRQNSPQGGMKKHVGKDVSILPFPEDLQGRCHPSQMRSSQIGEHTSLTPLHESQTYSLKLDSVRKEISRLLDSINSMEMQLMKLSLRREFLGSDSEGRLYWILAKLGRHPWAIISSKEMTLQRGVQVTSGSGASCPYANEFNDANAICPPWVSYQSDAEIKELVKYFRDDPKERKLKGSILKWLKVHDYEQFENQVQDEPQMAPYGFTNREKPLSSESLLTKAAMLLIKKHGPCSGLEIVGFLKKQGGKAKVTTEDKMFRCSCLELVWPSRQHCSSCHRTFLSEMELQKHHDALCKLGRLAFKNSKVNSALKGKEITRPKSLLGECAGETNLFQPSKDGHFEHSSELVKFENDALACPFNFKEICSKFATKNSTKELVQEIGIIGSDGSSMFVPSVSPYLSDPTLMLDPPKRDAGMSCEKPKMGQQLLSAYKSRFTTNPGHGTSSLRSCAANEPSGELESDKPVIGSLDHKDEKFSVEHHAPALEIGGNCCVIPQAALRPLSGRAYEILRWLKINLLDMDAALPEASLRSSKASLERRWAWRAFVKSAETIYEMVQAVIVLEDMIKTEYLKNIRWYWSSLSAAAKTSTLSSLALRIYALDASINYEKNSSNSGQLNFSSQPNPEPESVPDATQKFKRGRKLKRKRGD
ncbi:methyl-CpG-binding domain-containing protein 9 [Diospyros lotus]|uniref:methyl-CpG-binding domain-containing protein 9 n=1 Tax=Diospyros lotus TaxID=55363 RepID=UPI0022579E05|nr:methyl-CpG-binding domain-containing protein 9 [Diospyros lotus]